MIPGIVKWIGLTTAAALVAAAPARAQTAQFTTQGRTDAKPITYVLGPQGQFRALAGGSFSVHASAQVDGAAAPNPVVTHSPAQPANLDTLVPVAFLTRGGAVIGARKNPAVTAVGPYATSPKAFNGVVTSTTATKADVVVGPPAISATGVASVSFTTVNGRTIGDVSGSGATVTRLAGRAARATATTLIEDPLSFGGLAAGDALVGGLAFDADDLEILVDDPLGLYASSIEAGTSLLGSSPLGTSFAGNPLIYRLSITATSASAPQILFEHNPAFEFFLGDDPSLTAPILDSLVDSTIAQALASSLIGSPGQTYSLASPLALFSYRAVLAQSLGSLSVDYSNAQLAVVPEPATWLLAGLGGVGLALARLVPRRGGARTRRGACGGDDPLSMSSDAA